jgi:branched-chain amino acid transport system permease protein
MARDPKIVQRGSGLHRLGQVLLFGAVALFLIRAGLTWERPGLNKLTDGILFATAATGLNLLVGVTGQISIGHSAFFGLGAYTTAILVNDHGWTPGWTFLPAIAICFVVGMIVGIPALRLKGVYLALVSIAVASVFVQLLNYDKLAWLTGGPIGIKGFNYLPPEWTPFDGRKDQHKWFFWLALFVFVICSLIASSMIRSRFGRAMVAVRDNQTAAAVMGVNHAQVKTLVFGLSASMAGIAGSIFALKLTLVEPLVQFFILFGAIFLLVMVFLGGAASTWGPFVGALIFVYVRDWANDVGEGNGVLGFFEGTKIDGLGGIVFGILLIVLMFAAPYGLVGLLRQWRAKVVRVIPKIPPIAIPEGAVLATPVDVAEGGDDPEPTAGTTTPAH